MTRQTINVPDLARLPAFAHAVVADGIVYVSGTLGTEGDGLHLVAGEIGPQTTRALRNMERILATAGASLSDVVKVNVYITDMSGFAEMNQAYLEVFDDDPPARITVGCSELALGAVVELDCIAHLPAGA